MIKSTCCSFKGPGFSSQHLLWVADNDLFTLVLGPNALFDSEGSCMNTVHIQTSRHLYTLIFLISNFISWNIQTNKLFQL